jgi:hypothetical protein
MDFASEQYLACRVAFSDAGVDRANDVTDAGKGIAVLAVVPINDEGINYAMAAPYASVIRQCLQELELGFQAFRLWKARLRWCFSVRLHHELRR